MRKRRIAAYLAISAAYLALVGFASYRSPLLGAALLAAPIAFLAYRRFSGRLGERLKIPIVRLRNTYTASFYTDAPEMEVKYILSLGEELGVETKALLAKLPKTGTMAHRVIVYTKSLSEKASKQKLSLALKSMVAFLNLKGYRVVPDTLDDESLLEAEKESRATFPIFAVCDEDDYGPAVAKALELAGETTVIVTVPDHFAKAAGAALEKANGAGAARFASNFGFNMFGQLDAGLFADVAQACFGLSGQATLLLASTLAKAKKEGQPLDPYSFAETLEEEARTHSVSQAVQSELSALQEALKADNVWRGLVKDHPDQKHKTLVVDVSGAGPSATASFIAYMLAHRLVQQGRTVVLDLFGFSEAAAHHALNDVRLLQAAVLLVPKTHIKKEHLRGFGTLIYFGADETLRRLLADLGAETAQIQPNSSYVVTKSGSVSPFIKKSPKVPDEEKLEALVQATAEQIVVEDLSAKPRLPAIFKDKAELDAVLAALKYVEKYSTVEETSFEQALGLKAKSTQVAAKLVRLGYLKRKRKGGIVFVELTPLGQKELERLIG